VLIGFAGNLLFGRQNCLHVAEIHVNHPRIGALLNHTGDDVAFFASIVTQYSVISDVPQPLVDDLLGSVSGNSAEIMGCIGLFADFFALVVQDGG